MELKIIKDEEKKMNFIMFLYLLVIPIVTVVSNVIGMILFPKAYYIMYTLTVWIFLWIVFLLAAVVSIAIVIRTSSLFKDVDNKEKQIEKVLSSVQILSKNLYSAGNTLSKISENESSSAEELVATSEQLVESSRLLSTKTENSIENLGELSEWENVVTNNVNQMYSKVLRI